MPVRMLKKEKKPAGFSSTSQKGNILHGKLKSQKELKKITDSEEYKKSDYEGKNKKLNVATANTGMSVKQKKIAAKAPPPNVFNEKDLAVLREEKAKGRGMGLQDEKVQPGKVIKAKRGTGILAEKGTSKNFAGYTKVFEGPQNKGRVSTISGVKPNLKKTKKTFKSMTEMREAKGFKPGESASEFNKRRAALSSAKQIAKSTRLGKILLPVAMSGVALQQYLKSKMKKDKNKKTLKDFREQKKPGVPSEKTKTINSALNKLKAKKMGGGMMQKPMGYSKGTGPRAGRPAAGKATTKPKGGLGALGAAGKGKGNEPERIIILPSGKIGKVTKPKIDEKKGRHFRQHKTYDASPRLISDAQGKTFSLRSMNVGGMTKPMGYKHGTSVTAKCKLGRNKPTKIT